MARTTAQRADGSRSASARALVVLSIATGRAPSSGGSKTVAVPARSRLTASRYDARGPPPSGRWSRFTWSRPMRDGRPIMRCAQGRAASSRHGYLCRAGRDDRPSGDRRSPQQARANQPRRTGRVVLRPSTSALRRRVIQEHRGPLESAPMDLPDRRRGSRRHRACSARLSRSSRNSLVAATTTGPGWRREPRATQRKSATKFCKATVNVAQPRIGSQSLPGTPSGGGPRGESHAGNCGQPNAAKRGPSPDFPVPHCEKRNPRGEGRSRKTAIRGMTPLVEFPAEARKPGHWTLRAPVD
jgi:hypothetical protein